MVNPTLLSSKNIEISSIQPNFGGNGFSFPEVEVLANLDFADGWLISWSKKILLCSYFEDHVILRLKMEMSPRHSGYLPLSWENEQISGSEKSDVSELADLVGEVTERLPMISIF